ncbi:MAG: ligase-associated DNA damage response endonuclease PdeM [Cyclobacteriaceae bacterium]|nr:ligase-associated DNA damage response endonuclease PdeM [Cyclobacteriaceae bacterium]
MNTVVAFSLSGMDVRLLPQKALLIPDLGTLLIADLHLGKVNHFRKAGLPVPAAANEQNSAQLIDLIRSTQARRVIFLGDLFHSHYNPEWEVLGQICNHFSAVKFELVPGNHDIMSELQYERHGIILQPTIMPLGPFLLTHDAPEPMDGGYVLSGHVHPGIRLRGRGRQALTFPCFHFGKRQGLLPSFGAFTGMKVILPEKEDQVFAIAKDEIFEV